MLPVVKGKNLDGSSPIVGALKSTSQSRHTSHSASSEARTLTEHFVHEILTTATDFDCWSISFLAKNDYVWSCCRYTVLQAMSPTWLTVNLWLRGRILKILTESKLAGYGPIS